MNRTRMLRLACGASVLLLSFAVRISWSEDASDDLAPAARQAAARAPDAAPRAGELRQKMLELMARRAQRMNADELNRVIEELTKVLGDQDSAAAGELQKATEQLKLVVEK